jgi:uncharacterized protein
MSAPAADNALTVVSFGAPSQRLIGMFHAPSPAATRRHGVLICPAFGQEAIRAHRVVRVLAERLARNGHPVLRFDYFGTGDSMGDDEQGDIVAWTRDVLGADQQLRQLGGVDATVWVGMRLGAAIALQAAAAAPDGPGRLVLWDAVLDGPRYLEELREKHVATLEKAFSLMPRPHPRRLMREAGRYRDEAIGFALSTTLREQLAAMTAEAFVWPPRTLQIVALSDPGGAEARDLDIACHREPGRVRVVVAAHGTDWTTESAENTALVPTQALFRLVEEAGAAL